MENAISGKDIKIMIHTYDTYNKPEPFVLTSVC